jgi:hypothetical protein
MTELSKYEIYCRLVEGLAFAYTHLPKGISVDHLFELNTKIYDLEHELAKEFKSPHGCIYLTVRCNCNRPDWKYTNEPCPYTNPDRCSVAD